MVEHSSQSNYANCLTRLLSRLAEPAPGRIQILTGPRQVGKTSLLLEIEEKRQPHALYLAADGPEAALPGAWDRLLIQAEEIATKHGQAIVLLDEVHLLPRWSSRLKGEWDRLKRRKIPIHVVATGSSALNIALGSKESLAGRFERSTLTHWSARALASAFHLDEDEAVDVLLAWGGYPGVMTMRHDPLRCSHYVRDAILEPAIGRDMLALANIRRPALLRQVFGVCVSSPAQIVSLQKIQGQLQDTGALETVAHYLALLEEAYLVAVLKKHAATPVRQRAAPPKLVTLNNALMTVSDSRGAPLPHKEPERFGLWVENACLAHAINSGQTVTYWREEPFEVDAVLLGSWGKFVLEVKTGEVDPHELKGLFVFNRRFPDYKPLLLCHSSSQMLEKRLGITTMSWRRFLWEGLG